MVKRLTPEEREERARVLQEKREKREALRAERMVIRAEEARIRLWRKYPSWCPGCKIGWITRDETGRVRPDNRVPSIDPRARWAARAAGEEYRCPDCGYYLEIPVRPGFVNYYGLHAPKEILDDYEASKSQEGRVRSGEADREEA